MKYRRKAICILLINILILALLGGCVNGGGQSQTEEQKRLADEEYNAIFFSMFSIENYCEEDFKTYRGLETVILNSTVQNMDEILEVLNGAYKSRNKIQCIYLGVEPKKLWEACGQDRKAWEDKKAELMKSIKSHKKVTYEILLPYPDLSYWLNLPEDKRNEELELYKEFCTALWEFSNVVVHYVGAEEWLISNPSNYEGEGCQVNEGIAGKLLRHNFCDRTYQMNEDLLADKISFLVAYIEKEVTQPSQYIDLSDYYFIFFGDSIMAKERTTASVPEVIYGLTGAAGANLSHGGGPAASVNGVGFSLDMMIDGFLEKRMDNPNLAEDYYTELEQYIEDVNENRLADKELCFVISVGVNDYFNGYMLDNEEDLFDIRTYGGALRNGVSRLRKSYPSARIIIMSPCFCQAFENGTLKNGPDAGILVEYVEMARKVSEDMDADYINAYEYSGINIENAEQYLSDEIHPNESGSFLLGRNMIQALMELGL